MVIKLAMKNLIKREKIYYFRIAIPEDLREHFDGKRERQKSLGTKNPLEANSKAEPLRQEYKKKFQQLRAGVSPTQPTQSFDLEALSGDFDRQAKETTQNTLEAILELPLSGLKMCKELVFEATLKQLDGLLFHTDLSKADLKAAIFHPLSHVGNKTAYAVCEELLNGTQVTAGQLRRLARRVLKTLIAEGNTILEELHKELGLSDPVKEHHRPILEQAATQTPVSAPQPPSSPLLSAVLDECLRANTTRRGKASADQIKADVKLLMEWTEDKPVESYSKADVIDFRDKCLLLIPANRNKKTEYKELTARQLTKKKIAPSKRLSAVTVNGSLGSLSVVFNYAIECGYSRINPAKNLQVAKGEQKSKAFSVEQVKKLVGALELDPKKPSRYWSVMVGLHQGMRLNEICQLHTNDVYTDRDGIEVIDINTNNTEKTHKRLKGSSSKRVVPIHPQLIELGFMYYVKERQAAVKKVETVLFSDVAWSEDRGHRGRVSHWFNRVFKSKVLPEGAKHLNFHSFRHTFIQQAQNQARMSDRANQELTGHEVTGTSSVHQGYSGRLTPAHLLEELRKLDYGLTR